MTTHMREQAHRHSTETERALLAESAVPSCATSVFESGRTTPRASSPSPNAAALTSQLRRGTIADPSPKPYKGFPSEAHYIAALRDWAESKKYVQPDTTLIGYYGQTTLDEYASRPRVEFGISKLLRERKQKKEARRSSAV